MRRGDDHSSINDDDRDASLGTGWYWLLRLASLVYLLSLCCLIPAASGGRFEKHATLALVGYGLFLTSELGIRALIHFWVGQCDPWWPVSVTSGARLKGLPVWVFGVLFLVAGLINGIKDMSERSAANSSASSSTSEEQAIAPPAAQGFDMKVVGSAGTQSVVLTSHYPETLRRIHFSAEYSAEDGVLHKLGGGFDELPSDAPYTMTGLTAFDVPGSRFKSIELLGSGHNSKNQAIEIRCSWTKPADPR